MPHIDLPTDTPGIGGLFRYRPQTALPCPRGIHDHRTRRPHRLRGPGGPRSHGPGGGAPGHQGGAAAGIW
ncbi:hypothetical protein [Streptosporangium sp. NPDC003464]